MVMMIELKPGFVRSTLPAAVLTCLGLLSLTAEAGQTLVAQAPPTNRCETHAKAYLVPGRQPDKAQLLLLEREFRCSVRIEDKPSDLPVGVLISWSMDSNTIVLVVSKGPQSPEERPVSSPRGNAEKKPPSMEPTEQPVPGPSPRASVENKPLRRGPVVQPEPAPACLVKNYRRMDAERAVSQLTTLGCSPTTQSKLDQSRDGVVLDQDPLEGTFEYGHQVMLTVAERGVVIPPLRGLAYEDAASKLTDVSLFQSGKRVWLPWWDELVLSTSPASGGVVQKRSVVEVVVGHAVVSPRMALALGVGLLGLAVFGVRRLWIRPRVKLTSIAPLRVPEVSVDEAASILLSVEASVHPAAAANVEEGKHG